VIWRIPSVLESKPQIILRITDRPKILFEVLSAIASEEVNIESLKADTIIPEAKLALTLDIRKMDKLLAVCSKLRKIKGVTKLRWVKSD